MKEVSKGGSHTCEGSRARGGGAAGRQPASAFLQAVDVTLGANGEVSGIAIYFGITFPAKAVVLTTGVGFFLCVCCFCAAPPSSLLFFPKKHAP